MAATSQNSSHLAIEDRLPVVREQNGIYTKLPAVIDSSLTANSVTSSGAIRSSTSTALAASGGAAIDPTLGTVFTVTPTASETLTASSAPIAALVCLVVTTSGTSSFTLTFGTNFKSTGTLATGTTSGKVFTVTFMGDGTNMNEVARTTAM